MHKRHGGDKRGSSEARRRRKLRILHDTHLSPDAPHQSQCVHCRRALTFTTLEQDRIVAGGSYAFANVLPSCSRCNKRRSARPLLSFPPHLTFPA